MVHSCVDCTVDYFSKPLPISLTMKYGFYYCSHHYAYTIFPSLVATGFFAFKPLLLLHNFNKFNSDSNDYWAWLWGCQYWFSYKSKYLSYSRYWFFRHVKLHNHLHQMVCNLYYHLRLFFLLFPYCSSELDKENAFIVFFKSCWSTWTTFQFQNGWMQIYLDKILEPYLSSLRIMTFAVLIWRC